MIVKAMVLTESGHGDESPWLGARGRSRHLFPLGNRPVVFHNLEALRSAGVREAAILVEGESGSAIRAAVGDGRAWQMRLHYADWEPGAGLASALDATRDFVGDDAVLVQQGGALLRERMRRHISAFEREQLDALALRLISSAHPEAAVWPGCLLGPRAISMLHDHGEIAGDTTFEGLRAAGGRVRVQRVDGCMPCHGDIDALLESNRCVLERLEPALDGVLLDESTVQGAVAIHPSAKVSGSLLRGPLVIGPDVRVADSYIGPYSSIGRGAVVEGAEIEHSIVLPEAELSYVGTRVESSVIGQGARVGRGFGTPSALRLSIGDGAVVVLR